MPSQVEHKRALTDEVIRAWDECARRCEHSIPAAPPGRANSIADLRARLEPIREHLQEAVTEHLAEVDSYKRLKVRRSPFWQMGSTGALLKGYIWLHAALSREKTEGRLSGTFSQQGAVRGEYVAYPVSESDRLFHIQRLSRWMRNPDWLAAFRRGVRELPRDFRLRCCAGNEREINAAVGELTRGDWAALRDHGLDCDVYFVISRDRRREELRHLTVDELAQLIVSDWVDLSRLYPLLQGESKRLVQRSTVSASPVVKGTRRKVAPPPSGTFSPEFAGERAPYEASGSVRAEAQHGVVVNALSEELERMGFTVGNDRLRDLYVLTGKGRVSILFEAKTDVTTSSVYAAIGQLMLHGAAQRRVPRRVLVLPGKPDRPTRAALERLGLELLPYAWEGEEPRFEGLDELLR